MPPSAGPASRPWSRIRQGIRERFGGIGDGVARGLRLRHDHGSNYWADDFQQEVAFFGIESSPSFVREPEGNGVAERFIRTLKENLLWVRSFATIEDLRLALARVQADIQRTVDAGEIRLSKPRPGATRPRRAGRGSVEANTVKPLSKNPGAVHQVDVTFLKLLRKDGKATRRYQYTAIDDATRIRALKVYARHTQKNAIHFLDHVIKKFPFRMHTVRTDRGHEFRAQFHWHLADQGIRHVYIKARTPQLNGKVERSHRTDKQEFYQLLTYTGDVDLNQKLAEWENFYNYHRPHGAFQGRTPYEALREKLG